MAQNQDFEQLMGALAEEFQQSPNQPKKTGPQKQGGPGRNGLMVLKLPTLDMLTLRVPEVRPANNSRAARKEAEEQQRKLARMNDGTNRNILAQQSIVVVAVHAQRRLDECGQAMAERFYKGERYAVHNEFMAYVTNKCLGLAAAGVFAIAEVHPQHMAEEL